MTVVTRVALLCVIFLSGLEVRAQIQLVRCDGASCFVLHHEPRDFAGAQRSCTESSLLALTLRDAEAVLPRLMRGSSGKYWLELRSDSTDSPVKEAAAAGLQRCYAVSVSGPDIVTVSQEQCRDKQDGFLCHLENPCARLLPPEDTQVTYNIEHMGLVLMKSSSFPPGTIAVVKKKLSAEYPENTFVCFLGSWLQAPWRCEVLQGGCEHSCSSTTHTCTCPRGQTLHPNNITCTIPSKPQEGDSNTSACLTGYMLAQDGKSCVDVDECKDSDLCMREGEECLNTDGGYECTCKDGYNREDGECVDFSICEKCEHMLCKKSNGVYACACRGRYKVSPQDPTKCLRLCEDECLAECLYVENEGKKLMDCFCPKGYITDTRNDTVFCTDINECEMGECDHKCENLFGGYRCSCNEGFELLGKDRCVRAKDKEEEKEEKEEEKEDKEEEKEDKEEEKEDKEEEKEDKEEEKEDKEEEKEDKEEDKEGEYGSGSPPTLAHPHPAVLPPYIKTGSVLGITVFLALCAALLCLVVRNMVRRCGSFELPSFRPPDIDVFYLQQVTTETYKRLSFDKQFKNDLPRL